MKKNNIFLLIISIIIFLISVILIVCFPTVFKDNISSNDKSLNVPFNKINEVVSRYNVFTYLREIEFKDNIQIDDALMYFVVNELLDSKDTASPYYKYLTVIEEMDVFEIPKEIVNSYLEKYFYEIDYKICSKCKDDKYILPVSAIGDFQYDYNITNLIIENEEVTFDYTTLFYEFSNINKFEIISVQRFTIVTSDNQYRIKSIEILEF